MVSASERTPKKIPSGMDGFDVTLTDSIILLRYVESFGEVRRGLVVLKMRGSHHDPEIREYVIDETGMHIKGKLEHMQGLLWGAPAHVDPDLAEKLRAGKQGRSAE